MTRISFIICVTGGWYLRDGVTKSIYSLANTMIIKGDCYEQELTSPGLIVTYYSSALPSMSRLRLFSGMRIMNWNG